MVRVDYYAVLGVDAAATLDEIRTSYRQKVFRGHPDRGGSHAEMVRLNAAWEILSDPERRAAFDRQRLAPPTPAATQQWQNVERQANATAEKYPLEWDSFATWVDRITADVVEARYDTEKIGWLGAPVAANSVTGTLMILAGFIGGFALAYWLRPDRPDDIRATVTGYLVRAIVGLGGAWIGQILHRALRDSLTRRIIAGANASSAGVLNTIVHCPNCGQKLRLPRLENPLFVKCPKCRCRFEHTAADP